MSDVISVLLDDGLDSPLDYELPQDLDVDMGTRVSVPLHNRTVKGTIVGFKDTTDVPGLKPIFGTLPNEAHLPPELFKLAEWLSRYYATPIRRVIRAMTPAPLRGKARPKMQTFIKRAQTVKELIKTCEKMRTKSELQSRVLDCLLAQPQGMLLSELLELANVNHSPVNTLIKKGLITSSKIPFDRLPTLDLEFFPTRAKELNPEQQKAFDAIKQSIDEKTFAPHLIHGITGSGKTEIFLQAMACAIEKNRGIIMLVPEIALTAQTIERLKSRIPAKIAILHHRLSDGERFDAWQAIRRGEISIVVGARSAIFSPVQNLGLIIVDEEQESSYKNEEMPSYHARDVAVIRAKLSNCTAVLASATPSLESYRNALNGKYRLHSLTTRATNASLPKVSIIDMRFEYEKNGGFTLFCQQLIDGIKTRFEKGEQTLLFLNRRGYHPLRICKQCNKTLKCPSCDVSLTFHKSVGSLFCHTCGYCICPPPKACPYCKETDSLQYKGAGTEQVERVLHAILPEIRTLRMDADTTRHKGSHDRLFKDFRSGKADVLIGTQMIAKGLHFPSVTLVGVLNSDGALNIPDYRASESVFQLIAQVSGRSGRAELPGEVIIQTHAPDHPTIIQASKEDYLGFYHAETEARKLFDYPPFTRLARLIFTSPSESRAVNAANEIRNSLASLLPPSLLLLPITPCGCSRIKDQFRFQFLVKGKNLIPLTESLKKTNLQIYKVSILIDIDPISVYF